MVNSLPYTFWGETFRILRLDDIFGVEAETYAARLFTSICQTGYPRCWLVDSRYDVRSAHAVKLICYLVSYVYGDAPRCVDSGGYGRVDSYTE